MPRWQSGVSEEVPSGPMAMIGIIVGEFITARAGLGYIIMFASSVGETARALAAITFCGIGLALFGVVALGEMALRRWDGGEMPGGAVI
jgi:NitT/TauT family transport system permease protein